jgi:cell shape-determining protein MreC
MTKAEKQELKEIKDLLQKILERLENLKAENNYHYSFNQPKKLTDGYEVIWNYPPIRTGTHGEF